MTIEQVAKEIVDKMNNSSYLLLVTRILVHLEEMGLIKFESERESAIKEAKTYISDIVYPDNDDRLLTIRNMSNVIKRLVALLK